MMIVAHFQWYSILSFVRLDHLLTLLYCVIFDTTMYFCALLSVLALRHCMASILSIDGITSFVRLLDFVNVHQIVLLLCMLTLVVG